MTQDKIIEMANKAGWDAVNLDDGFGIRLKKFTALVEEKATEESNARANASWTLMCKKMVALEREACANVCDELDIVGVDLGGEPSPAYGYDCAKAIRARGEQA